MTTKTRPSKVAVVLVDMQDFFLQRISPEIRKDLVLNQTKLIKACASGRIPLIVLEYEGKGRGKTISVLQKEIKMTEATIIRKLHNSGFRDTDLEEVLKEFKVKRVVLMGINGSGCVQDTAIGALARGYSIVTSRGVIASASERDKNLTTSKKWFSANGTYFDEPQHLLAYVQKNSTSGNMSI